MNHQLTSHLQSIMRCRDDDGASLMQCLRLQNIDKTTRSPHLLGRRALADFEIGGKLIKKGQKIILASNYSTACLEEFLPTAEEFQPERWVIPGKSAVTTYKAKNASIFGDGPRVCAGEALAWAEMKVVQPTPFHPALTSSTQFLRSLLFLFIGQQ